MNADYREFELLYSANEGEPSWYSPLQTDEIFSHLAELLCQAQLGPPATILELGCGTGSLTTRLCDGGFKVTGLDISPTAIAATRKRLHAHTNSSEYFVADITSSEICRHLPLFDCVVDSLCLHYTIGEDRQKLLAHVRRILRPSGCFLVVTMCDNPRSSVLRSRFDETSRCICHGTVADRYLGHAPQIFQELSSAGFSVDYHRVVDGSDESGDQDTVIAVAVSRRAGHAVRIAHPSPYVRSPDRIKICVKTA